MNVTWITSVTFIFNCSEIKFLGNSWFKVSFHRLLSTCRSLNTFLKPLFLKSCVISLLVQESTNISAINYICSEMQFLDKLPLAATDTVSCPWHEGIEKLKKASLLYIPLSNIVSSPSDLLCVLQGLLFHQRTCPGT